MKTWLRDDDRPLSVYQCAENCHCEEQRDEAISISRNVRANEIASLAMTYEPRPPSSA
jgi:hypothetical protein